MHDKPKSSPQPSAPQGAMMPNMPALPPGLDPAALLAMMQQSAPMAPGIGPMPPGDLQGGNPLLALLAGQGGPPASLPPEVLEMLLAELLGGPAGGGMPAPMMATAPMGAGMPMGMVAPGY